MGQALVLGEGQIGSAVAQALRNSGWTVVVAKRGPSAAPPNEFHQQTILLDRDDPVAFRRLFAVGFDAAVDTVAFNAAHARQWLDVQQSVGTLVAISTGSVYADDAGRTLDEAPSGGFPDYPVPIKEDQRRASPGDETYSTRKVEMEDILLGEADLPVSILRPFAVYGPKSRSPREWWFLVRALAGQSKISLAFEGRSQFHTSATANIAELCRVVLEHPASQVLNAADPEAMTVAEIGQAIYGALKRSIRLDLKVGPPHGLEGRTPWTVERPIIADMSAAQALGYRPVTDYRSFVGTTCDALLSAATGRAWQDAFPGLSPYPSAMFQPDASEAKP